MRDFRAKYDPAYKWLGLGKREGDRPSKYGQSYKWIGLGKRDDSQRKFNPSYKYIGLGKREARSEPFVGYKYNPGYKWIGLGKRMAPYWSSQLIANFKDVFGENEKAGNSRGSLMRPIYSVVTKKLTPEDEESGTIFSDETLPPATTNMEVPPFTGQGRPNVRGGAFEPIYRYVGLGR